MTTVIVFDFANSEDNGEMQCNAAFHLGLLWLHRSYVNKGVKALHLLLFIFVNNLGV